MPEDAAVAAIRSMLAALEACCGVTGSLVERVRAQDARLLELSDDVALLGLRVSALEQPPAAGFSVRVAGADRFRTLDELAAQLRAELAAEVEQITDRIDHVHDRALKALTDLTERNRTA